MQDSESQFYLFYQMLNGAFGVPALFIIQKYVLAAELVREPLTQIVKLLINAGGRLRAREDQARGDLGIKANLLAVELLNKRHKLIIQTSVIPINSLIDDFIHLVHGPECQTLLLNVDHPLLLDLL